MALTTFTQRCGWFLLFLAACPLAVNAQLSSPKILFLHLKLESNQVSMVKASLAHGTLKRFSERPPSLDLEVATSVGEVIWTNRVADPSIRRLEYEDPVHPGEVIGKEVHLTNVEFTVRVPVFPNADHVSFYRTEPPAGTNAPAARPSGAAQQPAQRKRLGVVTLPAELK